MKKFQQPLTKSIQLSHQIHAQSLKKHRKRFAALQRYVSGWGTLFYCIQRRQPSGPLPSSAVECLGGLHASTICILSACYRAASFYLRDMIEISASAFYFDANNVQDYVQPPSWSRTLRPFLRHHQAFQRYNQWCAENRLAALHLTVLWNWYNLFNQLTIHLGTNVIHWNDCIPQYNKRLCAALIGAVEEISEFLAFAWLLYLGPDFLRSLEKRNQTKIGRIIQRKHKRFLRQDFGFTFSR